MTAVLLCMKRGRYLFADVVFAIIFFCCAHAVMYNLYIAVEGNSWSIRWPR